MLEQPLLFTGYSSIQFFSLPPLSRTQLARTTLVPYHSLCSTCVTCRAPCHAIDYQVLPTQPFLGEQRISLGVASIRGICLYPHFYLSSNQLNK